MSSLLSQNLLQSIIYIHTENSFGSWIFVALEGKDKGNFIWYILTNYHVIKWAKSITLIWSNENKAYLDLEKNEVNIVIDEENDIALIPYQKIFQVSFPSPKYISDDYFIKTKEEFLQDIKVWQELYMLGFPMGLGLEEELEIFPVARFWIVARNDSKTVSKNSILLDIQNFPWNSWGPIFVKPSTVTFPWETIHKANQFIGIIRAYYPYESEDWIQENSWVSIWIPSYIIYETISNDMREKWFL